MKWRRVNNINVNEFRTHLTCAPKKQVVQHPQQHSARTEHPNGPSTRLYHIMLGKTYTRVYHAHRTNFAQVICIKHCLINKYDTTLTHDVRVPAEQRTLCSLV